MTGIYIHVPFCASKCPYCDFYSLPLPDDSVLNAYTDEVCRRLQATTLGSGADTLYFGGGTPSLLGGERLAHIIHAAKAIGLTADAEITMEANPADKLYDTFAAFVQAGGNRLSMGMQSATAAGLSALGRRHTPNELARAVDDAHRAGLTNLSLDIMLGTPSQTAADIDAAVQVCRDADATHVSAYMLKIEEGTPFDKRRASLPLPDEDDTAALYLHACAALEAAGYKQYEISNFAKEGFESRHNLKYWNSEEYIGIGPAAHSFYGGKRTFYPRSLSAFLAGEAPLREAEEPIIDENSDEEYAMLRLRLTAGIDAADFEKRFARPLPARWINAARRLPAQLVTVSDNGIALTRDGFLLSNTLITRILFDD